MHLCRQRVLRKTAGGFGGFPQGIKASLRRRSARLKRCSAPNQFLQKAVIGVAMTGALIAGFQGDAPGQTQTEKQCSAAVVSRLLGSHAPVCDLAMVRSRAKDGHLFEQNQMGIRSILAIGPDYNEKEAMAWVVG